VSYIRVPAPRSTAAWIKAVLTMLVGLLAIPTVLVTGANAAAGAAEAATAASATTVQPGHAPTTCVNDVTRQFNSLKHHPEALGFHLGAGAFDPTSGRHYQGINRLPGAGTPTFITSRNGNPGSFEPPNSEYQPGEVNVVQLASRDTAGERVRSNRLVANRSVQDTTPPPEDKVVKSLKFSGAGVSGLPGYRHLGGMQLWGDVGLIGMDRAFRDPLNQSPGAIVLMNFADPTNPVKIQELPLAHQASSIGVAEFEPGRLLIVTTGNNGSPLYGYEVLVNGRPTTNLLAGDYFHPLTLRKVFEHNADINPTWPTGFQSLQTTNLYKDCNTGELFLMGGYNLSPFENTSRDRIGLWKINPTGNPRMTLVSKRQIWCEFDHTDRACNMGAASGFHVTPSGDLLMYGATHDNDGPNATVEMAEFSSQDGYDQDGAYRPVAVPGTYRAAVGSPITLDGTASHAAYAQARVELYDEPGFGGRGLVIDYPDMGREDYRHLSRVDDYNDEASSVRWRIPTGCTAVLFDDKDYKGPTFILPGADGSAQSVDNLRKFNDDTTSVRMDGDCDGRVVSWSWDLDADGTVEATGPRPTITPGSPGIHPLALEVCSGFGVCHRAVGSLDASAGTVPHTTAVVHGTSGTNDWYRSAVHVVLTATGDPTPTEIRWSATGADAMSEQTVAGASADVLVDAQGETVVHFRAVNSSGHEADQTVTVKVDTIAPTATVHTPAEGARFAAGTPVEVDVTCTDAKSGVASCSPDGAALDTAGTGARTLTAVATDNAGNTSSKVVHYTVTAPTVDAELVFVGHGDGSPGPILRANADGSNVVQLAAKGDEPAWSPDGSQVAYVSSEGGSKQVRVMNRDGSGSHAVTALTTWLPSSPVWSPDGSHLAFTGTWVEVLSPGEVLVHNALLTVPSAGGEATVLVTSDDVDPTDPTYSPDGASIVYVAGNRLRSVPATGVPAGELGPVVLDGLGSWQHPAHPRWSADGTTLVFQVWEAESFTADLFAWTGSGDPVNLTGTEAWPPLEGADAPAEAGPSWLPDGRVVFVQDGNVWAMAAQPGAEKVLLADLPSNVRSVDAAGT
jgi:hypothetical protein